MPNQERKMPENVPGPYYVDDNCIDCGQCPAIAPRIFTRCDEGGYSFVHHQPGTPEEVAEAEEARAGCPTDAIGSG